STWSSCRTATSSAATATARQSWLTSLDAGGRRMHLVCYQPRGEGQRDGCHGRQQGDGPLADRLEELAGLQQPDLDLLPPLPGVAARPATRLRGREEVAGAAVAVAVGQDAAQALPVLGLVARLFEQLPPGGLRRRLAGLQVVGRDAEGHPPQPVLVGMDQDQF